MMEGIAVHMAQSMVYIPMSMSFSIESENVGELSTLSCYASSSKRNVECRSFTQLSTGSRRCEREMFWDTWIIFYAMKSI